MNIDLASTILGAAGIKQPRVVQGRYISNLYLIPDPKWHDKFFYDHPVHLEPNIIPAPTALVRKNYKFLAWPDFNVEQLFNLEADPYELDGVVNATGLQGIVSEMRIRHHEPRQAALEPVVYIVNIRCSIRQHRLIDNSTVGYKNTTTSRSEVGVI